LPVTDNGLSLYANILINLHSMLDYEKKHSPKASSDETQFHLVVTGHSLGGALAQLFYARLLKSPGDLELADIGKIDFLGGYTYGGTRVGSFTFAEQVGSSGNTPVNRFINLWRVKDACDLVPRYPAGIDDTENAEIYTQENPQDILNFSHIGHLVYLHRWKSTSVAPAPIKIETWQGVYQWGLSKLMLPRLLSYSFDWALSWFAMFENWDPVNLFASSFPILGDHFPFRYYTNLGNVLGHDLSRTETPAESSNAQSLSLFNKRFVPQT